jgi:Putative auto-transporter adhesin, head GIN domain
MKINFVLTTLFASFVTLVSAGEIEKAVDPFTTVVVTGNYRISMVESTEEKVAVSNNDVDITDDKIIIDVNGGVLDIKIKGDTYKERDMDVTIYYKNVSHIEAKKGARITLQNTLKGDVIIFNCSMGGHVKGNIEAGTAKLKISQDGLINVTGKATFAEMEVATGGTLAAGQLVTETTNAKVTMGGSITVNATVKLTATVTSGGNISYKGNPATYEESIKLGGTITKLKD